MTTLALTDGIQAEIPLRIRQGQSVTSYAVFVDEDDQPIDFTGCTATCTIRPFAKSADTLASLSSAAGTLQVNAPVDGALGFNIPAATTAAWNWTEAVYDMRLLWPNGRVDYPMFGKVTVVPASTRP